MQISHISHKKPIPLTPLSDFQGSPTKHLQMQSLRVKSCNTTKYYHEVVIMEYPMSFFLQDTEFLQVILTCFTALVSRSSQASLHTLERTSSLRITSVNTNITQLSSHCTYPDACCRRKHMLKSLSAFSIY